MGLSVISISDGAVGFLGRTAATPLFVSIGASATGIGKAEDAVHASNDVGVMALAVRKDADAALEADGDYGPLQLDATGFLKVNVKAMAALPTGTNNIGDVDVLTLPALVAGTALIGKVGIDQTTDGTTNLVRARDSFDIAVSLTRTADTNAYAANDIIGAATGSTAALTFTSIGPSGGAITITGAELEIDGTTVISGMTSFRLHLYNVTPPSALGDNAAFDLPSGDRASYLGYVDLNTPVDLGSTLYVQSVFVGKDIKLSSANLFGYLVTAGGYTPESATVHKITLHATAR